MTNHESRMEDVGLRTTRNEDENENKDEEDSDPFVVRHFHPLPHSTTPPPHSPYSLSSPHRAASLCFTSR